ncbi:peptide synthetase [Paenibacillus sp. A3]|uniref:class I adenylate-forming enzyme family protein n=1 Tax=Paenibacillus sp. A3 TaxID=1337054 RepID=UPI0006D56992|nr:fatty acid--CoA ligase family protein [Paenibacillus sp. A3]KPV58006.1 peptide synthetase [Paenibacillus sp. A3]
MLVTQTGSRIITPQGLFTRDRFENNVHVFCHMLILNGIAEGDRVVLKAENSYGFVVALFSLCRLAVSITVVDEQINTDELSEIYAEVEACCLLTDTALHLPDAQSLLIGDLLSDAALLGETALPSMSIDKWIRKEDALILYTSGTTGKPKGIVKSGSSFMDNIKLSVQAMSYVPGDCLLPIVPFSHFYGISLIFSWWLTPCSLIICNRKNLWSAITHITKEKATVVDANPSAYYTIIRMLSRKPEQLEQVRNSQVRMWCVGGSPLTNDLEEKFAEVFGQPLLNGYGLSELGNVAMGTLDHPEGCGKPLPGVEVRIRGQNGEEQAGGELGQIWIRTPGCMEGYLNQEELTKSVLQDQWFKTGDLGFLQEGNLHVIGREGRSVNRMGYTFSPVYIENQISRLGYRSCVITLDDDVKGTLLVIFVESESSQELSLVRKNINRMLPTYMYPDILLLLPQFPLNRNGKVDRLELERTAKRRKV